MTSRSLLAKSSLAAIISVCTVQAQPTLVSPADVYQVNYVANLLAGDSFVYLTNAGVIDGSDPAGNICADVYVLAQDQQVVACCSCPLTPNHLKSLSARNDLISNTLTPGIPTGVTVALVASTTCNPSAVTAQNTTSGLRAWGTTLHAQPDGTYRVTESQFAKEPLSTSELAKLTGYCGFIQANGSGFGTCKTCREAPPEPPGNPGGGGGGGNGGGGDQ